MINLFKDYEKIHPSTMKECAESVWTSDDATLAASNGQSETYAHRAFSKFLFASVTYNLQKSVQNSISNSHLWNDGPLLVWAVLIYHFFPLPVALKVMILDKMKSATLAQHKNTSSPTAWPWWIWMQWLIPQLTLRNLWLPFSLRWIIIQVESSSKWHFNHIRLKFFMKPNKMQLLTQLLNTANHLHIMTTLPALPFTAFVAMSSKLEQNITALASILQSNIGSLKKVIVHVGQLNNRIKQGFKTTKTASNSNKMRGGNNWPVPTWINEAPTNANGIKEFKNKKDWIYCATCGHWLTTHWTIFSVHVWLWRLQAGLYNYVYQNEALLLHHPGICGKICGMKNLIYFFQSKSSHSHKFLDHAALFIYVTCLYLFSHEKEKSSIGQNHHENFLLWGAPLNYVQCTVQYFLWYFLHHLFSWTLGWDEAS